MVPKELVRRWIYHWSLRFFWGSFFTDARLPIIRYALLLSLFLSLFVSFSKLSPIKVTLAREMTSWWSICKGLDGLPWPEGAHSVVLKFSTSPLILFSFLIADENRGAFKNMLRMTLCYIVAFIMMKYSSSNIVVCTIQAFHISSSVQIF